MGNTSRTRLQAIHVGLYKPSSLEESKDTGTRGYQKKQLLQIATISVSELEDIKKKFATDSAKSTLIDTVIKVLNDQVQNIESSVGELAKIDTQSLKEIIAEVHKNRDELVKDLVRIIEKARQEIQGNKHLLNASAHDCLEWIIQNYEKKDDNQRQDENIPKSGDLREGKSENSLKSGDFPKEPENKKPLVLDIDIVEKIKLVIKLARVLGVNLTKVPLEKAGFRISQAHNKVKMSVKSTESIIRSEPVGYLHLEKVEFTPRDTVRGELIHSVPLAPGEEVSITNREWAQKSEEFEKIITDYMEEYSEEGVSEKAELAEAVSTQTQHSLAFNTGLTVTGTYGSVTASSATNLSINESANETANESRNKTVEMTHKASSRIKKDHKISFRIASQSEKEEKRVQTIVNPSKNRAARVDYYQMIRAWDVRLFRYGVRLTWDIMLPEPASDLLQRFAEIAELKKRIQQPFEKVFILKPGDLTPDNYFEKAGEYGVAVTTRPPTRNITLQFADHKEWSTTPEQSKISYLFEIPIPEGYTVKDRITMNLATTRKEGGGWGVWVKDMVGFPQKIVWYRGSEHDNFGDDSITIDTWHDREGILKVFVQAWDVKYFSNFIDVPCTVKAEFIAEWQLKAWEEIREAVQTRYYEERQTLQARLEDIENELSGEDALSLRRREREEIMKGVLRWLGVEGHEFYPSGLPEELYGDPDALYDPSTGLISDVGQRNRLVAHGDKIRFLHQAVEWENVLYFLYPYFWIDPDRWQDKLYLNHPDRIHKAFLKSGSCRVVLTIRPGFEEAFLAFINTGDMTKLPPSPYLEIGQELKNYASTNYAGIPPANPIENYRPLLTKKQQKAWDDIKKLIALLEKYKNVNTDYPSQSDGLSVLAAFVDEKHPMPPTKDPWGCNYVYRKPGEYNDFDLYSLGADGRKGGAGEDADITSWAEASLIGTWTEYTPTSALDIDFKKL